jgi:phosphoribosyl 1,2-cyclic phosphate phosphodiesterase
LEDCSLLIDTPEDINIGLNHCNIKSIENIMYSHWDPDHTMGMRIIEQLKLEWLDFFRGIKPDKPLSVYASSDVMQDLYNIRNPAGSYFGYYDKMKLMQPHIVSEHFIINDVKISLIKVPVKKNVDIFLFEQNGKKVIYAPCDCRPFPEDERLRNADLLILGNTFPSNTLKNSVVIGDKHPLRAELFDLDEAVAITEKYHVGKMILTHLEEDWGMSYDDYKEMEKGLDNIQFAYDGMEIII